MITCWRCGNTTITYYRQIIKGGNEVITARCANGHIPEKGKPFYPKYLFMGKNLSLLKQEYEEQQSELFSDIQPHGDLIKMKRQIQSRYPWSKS